MPALRTAMPQTTVEGQPRSVIAHGTPQLEPQQDCGTSTSGLREGGVPGFSNWFQSIRIGGLGAFTWPPAFSATPEGAAEALRLVQEYVPDAKSEPFVYGAQIDSTPSHVIVLPDGRRLNAGLLLDAYYHQGDGADSNSVAMLRAEVGLGEET